VKASSLKVLASETKTTGASGSYFDTIAGGAVAGTTAAATVPAAAAPVAKPKPSTSEASAGASTTGSSLTGFGSSSSSGKASSLKDLSSDTKTTTVASGSHLDSMAGSSVSVAGGAGFTSSSSPTAATTADSASVSESSSTATSDQTVSEGKIASQVNTLPSMPLQQKEEKGMFLSRIRQKAQELGDFISSYNKAAVTDMGIATDSHVSDSAQQTCAEDKEEEHEASAKQAEEDRIAAEKITLLDRLAAEKAEQTRIAREKEEKAKKELLVAAHKAEVKQKAEEERIAAEKADVLLAAAQKEEEDKAAAQKAERDRAAAEQQENERLAAIKAGELLQKKSTFKTDRQARVKEIAAQKKATAQSKVEATLPAMKAEARQIAEGVKKAKGQKKILSSEAPAFEGVKKAKDDLSPREVFQAKKPRSDASESKSTTKPKDNSIIGRVASFFGKLENKAAEETAVKERATVKEGDQASTATSKESKAKEDAKDADVVSETFDDSFIKERTPDELKVLLGLKDETSMSKSRRRRKRRSTSKK